MGTSCEKPSAAATAVAAPPTYPTKVRPPMLRPGGLGLDDGAAATAGAATASPAGGAAVSAFNPTIRERTPLDVPSDVDILQKEARRQLVQRDSFTGRHGALVDDVVEAEAPPAPGVSRFKAARMKKSGQPL